VMHASRLRERRRSCARSGRACAVPARHPVACVRGGVGHGSHLWMSSFTLLLCIQTHPESLFVAYTKTPIYSGVPTREEMEMSLTKLNLVSARVLGVAVVVASLGLGGCATYSDEFATINSRLDQLDARVQNAAQSAESANQSAQQANRRLDQIESRVPQREQAPRRQPRG